MAQIKPIKIGSINRLENLYSTFSGKPSRKLKPNGRETSPGYFNDASLNYSSATYGLSTKKYKA